MNKVKFKVKLKIVSLLVLLLAFLMLPFGQFEPMIAVGEYQISKEEDLRNWLNNVDNVQTNNPNAVLTQSMTINWGEYGVANYPATIESGSTLDGNGFTVYLPGGTYTTNNVYVGQLGLFADFVIGTLKNINFELISDYNITIDSAISDSNEQLYVGVVCGKMENGTIENCSVKLDKSITFKTIKDAFMATSSNHFGVIAGGMWGNAVVSNTSVIQTSNSTIDISCEQAYSYLRIALISGDPYSQDGNIPTIKNVYVERNGQIVFGNNGGNIGNGSGGEIYGAIVGDIDTGGDGSDHNIKIDGVIYNSIYNGVYEGVTYQNRNQRSDNTHGYIIGARKKDGTNFSIANIYSLVEMTDTDYVKSSNIGYTLLPSGYSYDFNGDNLVITKNEPEQNSFIWSVSNNTGNDYQVYKQLSNSVEIPKKTVDVTTLKDTLNFTFGQIIDSAIAGFEENQAVYSGKAFQTVRIKVGDKTISEGFGVNYKNNINAFATTGEKATFELQYPDRDDGIFITSDKSFIKKEGIEFDNPELNINQAKLEITYKAGDVYTNSLNISGLVNNEQVTIDGKKYGNGETSLDCVGNSVTKTISFEDGAIASNYDITQNGLEDLTFEVQPKTVSVGEGISIINADGQNAVFKDNQLTIYSKNYQSIKLNFTQNEGYLNSVEITAEDKEFKISQSLSGTTMTYELSCNAENDLHYLTSLSLEENLQKVAVKIEVDTNLLANLLVNGEKPVRYGDYLLISADYNQELEFVITLLEDYQNYQISYNIDTKVQIEGNSFKVVAKSQQNNFMLISIDITEVV